VERINRSYALGPISYLLATLLALLNAYASLVAYAVMAVFWSLPIPAQGQLASKVKRRAS
jgi:hypothetical protein